MNRLKLFPYLLIFLVSGCIYDTSDSPPPQPQGFTYSISPLGIDTHPGGGGLILVSLDPSKEFTGNLYIRVYPPEHVRVVPEIIRLTPDWKFDEIEVYIDSTAAVGEMEMDITAEHEGVKYETPVPMILSMRVPMVMEEGVLDTHNLPPSLSKWLSEDRSELGIDTDGLWSSWCENPRERNEMSFRYINMEWDIRMQKYYINPGIYQIVFYSVRKRGDPEPFLYAKSYRESIRDKGNEDIIEIPKSEFGRYSWVILP